MRSETPNSPQTRSQRPVPHPTSRTEATGTACRMWGKIDRALRCDPASYRLKKDPSYLSNLYLQSRAVVTPSCKSILVDRVTTTTNIATNPAGARVELALEPVINGRGSLAEASGGPPIVVTDRRFKFPWFFKARSRRSNWDNDHQIASSGFGLRTG